MAYGYDSKRDEAYMEGPMSSATTSLLRVAGKFSIFVAGRVTNRL